MLFSRRRTEETFGNRKFRETFNDVTRLTNSDQPVRCDPVFDELSVFDIKGNRRPLSSEVYGVLPE